MKLTEKVLTKAGTLEFLRQKITSGVILPSKVINVEDWVVRRSECEAVLAEFLVQHSSVIVRSSAAREDGALFSHAGEFLSIPNCESASQLFQAIDSVVASYGSTEASDEILIQPMLHDTVASGVAMTRDPSSGYPYLIVEICDGGDTSAVTGGTALLKRFTLASLNESLPDGIPNALLSMLKELDAIFDGEGLDVEFGITKDRLVLFQCRPITFSEQIHYLDYRDSTDHFIPSLVKSIERQRFTKLGALSGRTIFGVMPDWNPAEIIGLKPKYLAFDLYKYLITETVWSKARADYGYKRIGPKNLLIDFGGTPYVDVRASFASLIPADLPDPIANKILDAAIEYLEKHPTLHDKVEFEIIPNCMNPKIMSLEMRNLYKNISDDEWSCLVCSLNRLTNKILDTGGSFDQDILLLDQLSKLKCYSEDFNEEIESIRDLYTPLFARLARAAFVCTSIVKSTASQINGNLLIENALHAMETVSSKISEDFKNMNREDFLSAHGHMRPGTYEITTPSYSEEPDRYFDWSASQHKDSENAAERLSLNELDMEKADSLLKSIGLSINWDNLISKTSKAVAAREQAKYIFTRKLSHGFTRLKKDPRVKKMRPEMLSFLALSDIGDKNLSPDELAKRADVRKMRWTMTECIRLPPLIVHSGDARAFSTSSSLPTYVTSKSAEGRVASANLKDINDSIVFIESADPGFDWIFTKPIKAFVTCYGGENSHMAIRAREFGIPAVLGAGEVLFNFWRKHTHIRIDCAQRRTEVLI